MKIEITEMEKELIKKAIEKAYEQENKNCWKYGEEYDTALLSSYAVLLSKLKGGAK